MWCAYNMCRINMVTCLWPNLGAAAPAIYIDYQKKSRVTFLPKTITFEGSSADTCRRYLSYDDLSDPILYRPIRSHWRWGVPNQCLIVMTRISLPFRAGCSGLAICLYLITAPSGRTMFDSVDTGGILRYREMKCRTNGISYELARFKNVGIWRQVMF